MGSVPSNDVPIGLDEMLDEIQDPIAGKVEVERCASASDGIAIDLAGHRFVADASGALYHETGRTILVADLHLEKASRYASRGQMLPPYDTAETLSRLAGLVRRFRPARLICLGDSFHDVGALDRMAPHDAETIRALSLLTEIVWLSGNHDPDLPAALPGHRAGSIALGDIVLRHEPSLDNAAPEICGHLHPVARVATRRGSLRRRCFAATDRRLVMPAFGALTGGLNIRDAAFAPLFGATRPSAYVIGSARVYPVADRHLFGD